jgi:hypothetical protein
VLISPGTSLAQSGAVETVVARATQHFMDGEYFEAADLFGQAYLLDPHPNILYNRARCFEELGNLPRALEIFRAALDDDPSRAVETALREKIEEVEGVLLDQGYDLSNIDPETFVALASLTITSLPSGAEVRLGNEIIGTTPVEGLFIAPGNYRLTVTLSGHHTHHRSVEIVAAGNVSVHAGLRRDEVTEYVPLDPGFLELIGPRRGMQVYLDEDFIGSTPLSGTALPPGRYRVRVAHPDYQDWVLQADVVSGETTRLYADAIREEPDIESSGPDPSDWGLIAMGVGGATMITGVIIGVIAQADEDRYHRNVNTPNRGEIRQSALDEAVLADIFLGTSGALVLTGILLILTEGEPDAMEYGTDLVRIDLDPQVNGWLFSVGINQLWQD